MRSENITRLKSSNDFRDSLSEGFKCAVVAISVSPLQSLIWMERRTVAGKKVELQIVLVEAGRPDY